MTALTSKLFIIVFGVLCWSCRPKFEAKPVYTSFNDFDGQIGWYSCNTNNSFIVEKMDAYSGVYATRIKNGHDFGYIYKVKIADLDVANVTWVKYSAMCKKITGGLQNTSIICEVTDSLGQRIDWLDVPLKFKLIERNVWIPVDARFNLAKLNNKDYSVALFIWNKGSGEELLEDDIRIDFFK